MANHLAMAALIEPDDEVLIEEPGYEALISAALYLGAKVRRFSRRFEAGFQLDPREVERSITPRTRLIVVTNLHNPTGVRTPDSTLKLIGEIARSLGGVPQCSAPLPGTPVFPERGYASGAARACGGG